MTMSFHWGRNITEFKFTVKSNGPTVQTENRSRQIFFHVLSVYLLTVIPVIPLHNMQVISDCLGVIVSDQFDVEQGCDEN